MKIHPQHDRVLIKPIATGTSPGGIVIPETASPGLCTGKVVAIGPGTMAWSGFIAVTARTGWLVRYDKKGAHEVDVDGEKLHLIVDGDILYRIEES